MILTLIIIATIACGVGALWTIIWAFIADNRIDFLNAVLMEVILGFTIYVMWYSYSIYIGA